MEVQKVEQDKAAPSQLSMMLLKRQKGLYDSCAMNATEKRIIEATFGSTRLSEAVADQQTRGKLIDQLGFWRKCMGTSGNLSVDEKQIIFEVDFLCKYFKDITLLDLDWMIELYILRLLPMEYPVYVVFNPDYLARVIHAYRTYKTEKRRRLEDAVAKKAEERESTPAGKRIAMIWMIEELWYGLQDKVLVPRHVEEVYKFLRRAGFLGTGVEHAEQAKEFALQKIALLTQGNNSGTLPSTGDVLPSSVPNAANKQQVFVHLYCIVELFKKIDHKTLASRIEEKHFVDG